MRPKERLQSVEEVRSLLDYNPETGSFWRRRFVDGRCSAGRPCGSKHHTGYVYISIHKVQHCAHRLAYAIMTGDWPDGEIDHINRVRSDNRWANLRVVTKSRNMQNSTPRVNASSKYKGVDRYKGKFRARIQLDKKPRELGRFKSELEAAKAYDDAARKLHGDYACLNFPG